MARTFCQKCRSWIDKADYKEENSEALARHESSCALNLANTMFGQHPDLIEIQLDLEQIKGFYGTS